MQKPVVHWLSLVGALVASLASAPSRASDHADPMSLNVFAVQQEPEANITDLHAFIVDESGRPITANESFDAGHRLIVSLCVRRALRPGQEKKLDLAPYTFRVHFDLNPPVRFVPPTLADGKTGLELAGAQRDLSMQALYGGIITHPEDIADSALLEFDLLLAPESNLAVRIERVRASGLLGPTRVEILGEGEQPPPDQIGVTAGVFDDPFIFPRFFRRNVVGVVASIPLSELVPKPAPGQDAVPILLWATTHAGSEQIDHVGRSLRTQLPRFGHLNVLPPSEHVHAITRVHAEPTIMEALLSSIIAPLLAHRHYDSVPDVMVYDLHRPAKFPNGRWLEDDVAKTLADAGETLLFELSYAESRQFPRATANDKAFRTATNPDKPFPYLAARWEQAEVNKATPPDPTRSQAPDGAAIAPPTLDDSVWRRLFSIEVGLVVALVGALVFTLRSVRVRGALVVAAFFFVLLLTRVYRANLPATVPGGMEQPGQKVILVALGALAIVLLLLGWLYALGRRFAKPSAHEPVYPRDRQGPIADDSRTRSYAEIYDALFKACESRPYYKTWGKCGEPDLPYYKSTFASITADLFSLRDKQFAMERAARRTVKTRGDLRWGADRNGFRRLVHPMGVCLAGTWRIDPASPKVEYTGYFAPGREGRVIARYSLGGNQPKGGHNRSLGLVGKVFPPADAAPAETTPRAHFITQEDLGGAFTCSIRDALLTNSPPVTLLRRGSGLFAFVFVIIALMRADAKASERQLYEIAELEEPEDAKTSCPRFMRLRIAGGAPSFGDEEVDFRHEILGAIYDPGDKDPKRKLVFTIEVSDRGRRTLLNRVVGQQWTRIGSLTFHEAAASYNGDFVVHFHHPPWRRDRNDPRSVKRKDLRS